MIMQKKVYLCTQMRADSDGAATLIGREPLHTQHSIRNGLNN